ncbi:MAG: recombinase family protein [Hyphomicrobiales bacterium]
MQLDALASVGCESVFQDHGVSGAKAERPGLDQLFEHLVAGDMLVVYKLDRLGRSSFHLADLLTRLGNMDVQFCSLTEGINTASFGGRFVYHLFAAVAEFHRDLIRENTINGLQAARERGSKIGRPPKLSDADALEAHRQIFQEGLTISDVARRYGVSESTIHRKFRNLALT